MPAYLYARKIVNIVSEKINMVISETFWLRRKEYGLTMRYAVGTRKTGNSVGIKEPTKACRKTSTFLVQFM